MDRRDALKSIAALASSTGLTVTPVTTKDAEHVALILIKSPHRINQETAERLRACWEQAMVGTSLEGVRTVVLGDGLEVEVIRK